MMASETSHFMPNEKLEAIAKKAASNLEAYIYENESKIIQAWNDAEDEARDNETKARFRMGFAIILNLDKKEMETALTFGVKFKASSTCTIPDPSQTELPWPNKTEKTKEKV